MSRRAMIRRICRRVPADLRAIRGKLMIEGLCETLGVLEVDCPACRGSGWLSRRGVVHCPLCQGFGEVPDRLADWFRTELRSLPVRSGPAWQAPATTTSAR